MIVTYNWLKEYVDFTFNADELAHRLTMAGLEVDAMERFGEGLDSVIVARLKEVAPHPDADRLTVCQVDTGSEVLQVVCGARNHKTGDLVALAQVGTVLPGDFKIKKSKIRGQESFGMLCSEKELGLAEESEGILILPSELPLGRPVFAALGLKDVRYELGLTPNRPDCLSIIGVAREVAAMAGRPLQVPQTELAEGEAGIDTLTSVTIDEPAHCPRYAARLIRGVRIGPSPAWLVRRLESIGQRSINNVVDVTNLVLMELGHPLHAFDFDLLRGGRIVVKKAEPGSTFVTLDSQPRLLTAGDLMICDAEGPVALAGIMGGENSEIRDETANILLESAYFNPLTIRRTSKRLGLRTEASHRFERGADMAMVPVALDRAAALIVQVAGGCIDRGRIDNYPEPYRERRLVLSVERANALLGTRLSLEEMLGCLRSIGLGVQLAEEQDAERLVVDVPAFRPDLEREIDLIEEIARLHGYEQIPATMPVSRMLCQRPAGHLRSVVQVRNHLVAAGFSEAINYSFIAPSSWDRLALAADDVRRNPVTILNPLTEEQSVLRTTLVPSLLETVARNLSYQGRDLRLFEVRPVFLPRAGEELPEEKWRLCAVWCGRREAEGWSQQRADVDFFDLKGLAESLLDSFRVEKLGWLAGGEEPFLHPGKSCRIQAGSRALGTLGEVHPRILEGYDIDLPVYLLDLDLEELFAAAGGAGGFMPLSRFPQVCRDSALLVAEAVTAGQVLEVLQAVRTSIVEDFALFDVYQGPGIPEGKKSLAVRVRYRSAERTLTEEDIQRAHDKLLAALGNRLGAEVR